MFRVGHAACANSGSRGDSVAAAFFRHSVLPQLRACGGATQFATIPGFVAIPSVEQRALWRSNAIRHNPRLRRNPLGGTTRLVAEQRDSPQSPASSQSLPQQHACGGATRFATKRNTPQKLKKTPSSTKNIKKILQNPKFSLPLHRKSR